MRSNNSCFPLVHVPHIRRWLETPSGRGMWSMAPSPTCDWNTEFKLVLEHQDFGQLLEIFKDWSQLHCCHFLLIITVFSNNILAKSSSTLQSCQGKSRGRLQGWKNSIPAQRQLQQGQQGALAGPVRDGQHHSHCLPHWFLPQAVLWGLTVLWVWCTPVSPTHKQQLPLCLRLDGCKCQQTKEHTSRFIFISSSTLSWYFNALQVLIKDLAMRNLREGFRAGPSSAAWLYQIKCNCTNVPALPTNHKRDSCIVPLAELFTWQKDSAPDGESQPAHRHWLCSGALGSQGSTQRVFPPTGRTGQMLMNERLSTSLLLINKTHITKLDSVPSTKTFWAKLSLNYKKFINLCTILI